MWPGLVMSVVMKWYVSITGESSSTYECHVREGKGFLRTPFSSVFISVDRSS